MKKILGLLGVILVFTLVCVCVASCGDGSATTAPQIPGIGSTSDTTNTTEQTGGTTASGETTGSTNGTKETNKTTATNATNATNATTKPTGSTTATKATTKPSATTTVPAGDLVIFLDPGHGGTDVGTTREFDYDGDGTKETYNESEIALAVALKAKAKLEKLGYKVVLSREDDSTVSLAHRPAQAIEAKANMFISIHVNSYGIGGQTAVSGFEAYYTGRDTIKYDGKAFADLFTKEFTEILDVKTDAGNIAYPKMNIRGTKSDEDLYGEGKHLAVLNPIESYIPSTLLELGYITNDGDLGLLRSTYWQNFAAEAIADAVVQAHIAGIYKTYDK